MPATPSRASSGGATRRVSFFHASSGLYTPLSIARSTRMSGTSSHKSPKDAEREKVRQCANTLGQAGATTAAAASAVQDSPSVAGESHASQPAHVSRCARGASSSRPSCQPLPEEYQRRKIESPSSSRVTMQLEFSLENTPLAGTRPPPVWRESSLFTPPRGSRNSLANLPTPSRRIATVSDARNSVSTPGSNPYTDVEREISNQRRRHAVVRYFFVSHEGAIRLNIRLQQLLKYRDLCEAEWHERLQVLPPEEASVAAHSTARSGRATETEREIERVQAALARLATSSLELAETLEGMGGLLTPLQLAPRSHHATTAIHGNHISSAADVGHAGEKGAKGGERSFNEDAPAAARKAGEKQPPVQQSVDTSASSMTTSLSTTFETDGSYSLVESPRTTTVDEAARQHPPSQPHISMAAWRNNRKDDLPVVERTARSAKPSQTESARATASHGITPRNSTAASDFMRASMAATPKVAVESAAATDTKTRPGQPPFSSPRRKAASTTDSEIREVAAAKATPPRRMVIDCTSVSPPRSDHRTTESWLRRAAAPHHLASAPPQQPPSSLCFTKATVSSAVSVKLQHLSGATASRANVLAGAPDRRTPVRAQGQLTSPSLTDSPLARYRAKQGYRNPERHFSSQVADAPRQTASATRSPAQRAAATGQPSGMWDRERSAGPVAATRVSGATGHATLHEDPAALMQERRRRGPVRNEGNPDAFQERSAVQSQDKTSTSMGRWSGTLCASAAKPSLMPSPRPSESRVPARKPPLESVHSWAASTGSSPPPHSRASDVPTTGQSTEPTAVASSTIFSHPPTNTSHLSPSDARQQGSKIPTASASALGRGSATPSTNASAAYALTGSAISATDWNVPFRGADVAGPSASVPPNQELPSDEMASWFPADSAVESTGDAVSLPDVESWPVGEPQRAEQNAEVSAGGLLRGTTHGRSTEPRMEGCHSIWDKVRALEDCVVDLESRTRSLEKNAEKRAVLEVIEHLKARVGVLEERTTLLEQRSSASHLRIHWEKS
ncbi:conserved hypothetical protein [Leishmania mexicana MHOM/GT/2001/U1103]|uniref:Uncharacterized protein n=1 Tax=Leishmania mexicana (strain MHOM/GT/2001/U1103) TaxID=929439 RepID=E9B1S8_LEIMU|nr:conserved hypothetical protein [Leishmania mexicana MHOM/GT/2001/U1103]CBZ29185.1 conserved hypothetical protein [Leishmania mexicana MHOM/GT/2001/U1103]